MTDRQVQETVARCVSTMVFYHNCERSRTADEQMAAEIQLIAAFVEEMGLDSVEIQGRIIRPVESELIVRYGHEVGPRMFDEFCDAFESIKSIIDVSPRRPEPSDSAEGGRPSGPAVVRPTGTRPTIPLGGGVAS